MSDKRLICPAIITVRTLENQTGAFGDIYGRLIRERTAEGRARAKKAGKSLGRPHKLTMHQRAEVLRLRAEGQDNASIARLLGVSRPTISRIR
jgi:DNA invertase Pin-like site-specific DNA recombinase